MIIIIQIVVAVLVLRAFTQVGLSICQISIGVVAGILSVLCYVVAMLLECLVVLWITAFPRGE